MGGKRRVDAARIVAIEKYIVEMSLLLLLSREVQRSRNEDLFGKRERERRGEGRVVETS